MCGDNNTTIILLLLPPPLDALVFFCFVCLFLFCFGNNLLLFWYYFPLMLKIFFLKIFFPILFHVVIYGDARHCWKPPSSPSTPSPVILIAGPDCCNQPHRPIDQLQQIANCIAILHTIIINFWYFFIVSFNLNYRYCYALVTWWTTIVHAHTRPGTQTIDTIKFIYYVAMPINNAKTFFLFFLFNSIQFNSK